MNRQQPSSSPQTAGLSKKLWIGIGMVVAVSLLAMAVVFSVCAAGGCAGLSASPIPPRLSPRAVFILDYINDITLTMGRTLDYPSSATAEERAVQWLIDVDKLVVVEEEKGNANTTMNALNTTMNATNTTTANKRALRQRYVLATVLLFPTTTSGDVDTSSTDDAARNNAATTLPMSYANITECDWSGVECDEAGNVTELTVSGAGGGGGGGIIPDDIGLLTALTGLSLVNDDEDNKYYWMGTIPSSLARLTDLTVLDLSGGNHHGLTGTIPSSWGSALTALTDLRLHDNRLNGTVPFCGTDGNRTFTVLVADCDEVNCPCCIHCCPTGGWKGIPGWDSCTVTTNGTINAR